MYPHIYEINRATKFYGKITGQYTVHLPYRFHAAENAVCWSHSTVRQFNHITTILQTSEFEQVSPSLSMVTKGHFSWYVFLNVWKRLLLAGDAFAGARSIDLAMLSLKHKTFLEMVLWFRRSIQLAASRMRCSLQETSEKLFFCFVSFVHAQSTSDSKSAYFYLCACAMCPKVALISCGTNASATLGENRKSPVCLLLLFHEWQNLELLRGYPYFQRTPYWFWWFSGTNTVEP